MLPRIIYFIVRFFLKECKLHYVFLFISIFCLFFHCNNHHLLLAGELAVRLDVVVVVEVVFDDKTFCHTLGDAFRNISSLPCFKLPFLHMSKFLYACLYSELITT